MKKLINILFYLFACLSIIIPFMVLGLLLTPSICNIYAKILSDVWIICCFGFNITLLYDLISEDIKQTKQNKIYRNSGYRRRIE